MKLRLLFLLLPCLLHAAEPPSAPILPIEAGMHTAKIGRIATDAAGRVALTCSFDKTARLWSLEKGREGTLLRTLRVPIGEGKEGMLYACALSPDGKLAAVGGCTVLEGSHTRSTFSTPPAAASCGSSRGWPTW